MNDNQHPTLVGSVDIQIEAVLALVLQVGFQSEKMAFPCRRHVPLVRKSLRTHGSESFGELDPEPGGGLRRGHEPEPSHGRRSVGYSPVDLDQHGDVLVRVQSQLLDDPWKRVRHS